MARHMQQTEKLRQFLTGRLFQTLLDAAFLPVLLALLVLYSGHADGDRARASRSRSRRASAALLPLFRSRLTKLYVAEAEKQAQLVETLHNMRAVKALVLEPIRQSAWDASMRRIGARASGRSATSAPSPTR